MARCSNQAVIARGGHHRLEFERRSAETHGRFANKRFACPDLTEAQDGPTCHPELALSAAKQQLANCMQ